MINQHLISRQSLWSDNREEGMSTDNLEDLSQNQCNHAARYNENTATFTQLEISEYFKCYVNDKNVS